MARPLLARPLGHAGGWRGAALAGGLALVLVAPSLAGVVAGLVLFGAGMGITYYAALYYALAVGHAAVDAGGTFEALIGLGYCVGPLLGLCGQLAPGAAAPARPPWPSPGRPPGLIAVPALRPYLQARRRRAGGAQLTCSGSVDKDLHAPPACVRDALEDLMRPLTVTLPLGWASS